MIIRDGYTFGIALSGIGYLVLFAYAFRFRRNTEAFFFLFVSLLLAFQAFSSLGELRADGLADKLRWRDAQQIPLYLSPVALLGMIMAYLGTDRRTIVRRVTVAFAFVALYLALLYTDAQHHLIRESATLEPYGESWRVSTEKTFLGVLFVLADQAIGIWPIVLLAINYRKALGIQKRQHVWLLLAIASPSLVMFASRLIGWDMTVSVSMLPALFMIAYALFIYRFLQIRPIAAQKVLEHMNEGIVIVDERQRIVDANPAALAISARIWKREKLAGERLPPLLETCSGLKAFYEAGEQGEFEGEYEGRHYSVRLVPLIVRNRRTGFLFILSEITERKEYENRLIRQATLDGLTELHNRRSFLERLEEERVRARSTDEPVSLLLLDLDEFKKINDGFGHLGGDRVLRGFADLLADVLGDSGTAGRVGGEEFAIVLPGCSGGAAYELAERIRERIRQEPVMLEGQEIAYTISIGAAELAPSGMTLDQWYQEADTRLYDSKRNGRNRTTIAG